MRADDSRRCSPGRDRPAAATEATLAALPQAAAARAVVLVEGVSDQIAVETLARRRDRDLAAEGVVVLPTGGVHGIARYLRLFGPDGTGARLAGLCDAAEEHIVRRGLATAGVGAPASRAELERLGFYVCVADLEDELNRAASPALAAEALGPRTVTRRVLHHPAPGRRLCRAGTQAAQLRRFLGAGSHRKLRYARLLTEAIDSELMPRPLEAALAAV